MLNMFCEISIGPLRLYRVKKIEIESAKADPAAVMKIFLPRIRGYRRDLIKPGDKVVVKCGYKEYGAVEEFSGYVMDVSPTQPLEIRCKDEMHKLQSKRIHRNFYNVSIKYFLSKVAIGYQIVYHDNCENIRIQKHITNGRSAAWALKTLKWSKIDIFFIGNILHVVRAFYLTSSEKSKRFKINYNIIDDKIKHKSEKSIRVRVKSYNPSSGKYRKYTYGKSGDIKEFDIDDLDAKGVKERAKELWKQLAAEGLAGSFTAFGYPSVSHSEYIQIIDKLNENRNREAFISKVTKTFDAENAQYRQNVDLEVIR